MGSKKGKGYIFKRNGVYYARIKFLGRDITHSLKTADKDVAKNRWQSFVQSIVREGRNYDKAATLKHLQAQLTLEKARQAKSEQIKINDMFSRYLLDHPLHTEGVERNNRGMVKHFVRWYKRSAYMSSVTREDVMAFIRAMRGVMTNERLFNTIACLRRVWDVCMVYDKYITENVWKNTGVKIHHATKPNRRELTNEEIERLIHACDRAEFSRWNGEVRVLFQVGAFSSLRLMDCIMLRWRDVGARLITVVPHKTRKTGIEARIPISCAFRQILDDWRMSGNSSDDYVLPMLARAPRREITKIVSRVFGAAGIAVAEIGADGKRKIKTGFHSLRVTALSNFFRLCHDINVVKSIAGHAHANMTLWYAHCQERDVLNAFFKDEEKADDSMALSADVSRQISALKSAGETTDDFIRKLLAQTSNPIAIAS